MNVKFWIVTFIIFFTFICGAQPVTYSGYQCGVTGWQSGKSYIFLMEIKNDSISGTRLIEGQDYLSPSVTDLIITPMNQHVSNDTLYGEIKILDRPTKQFVKFAVLQKDNVTLKYSATTVSYWFVTDTIEPKPKGWWKKIFK